MILFVHAASDSGDDYYFVLHEDMPDWQLETWVNLRAQVNDDAGCVTVLHVERVDE